MMTTAKGRHGERCGSRDKRQTAMMLLLMLMLM